MSKREILLLGIYVFGLLALLLALLHVFMGGFPGHDTCRAPMRNIFRKGHGVAEGDDFSADRLAGSDYAQLDDPGALLSGPAKQEYICSCAPSSTTAGTSL
jgi:hypothetical protein